MCVVVPESSRFIGVYTPPVFSAAKRQFLFARVPGLSLTGLLWVTGNLSGQASFTHKAWGRVSNNQIAKTLGSLGKKEISVGQT